MKKVISFDFDSTIIKGEYKGDVNPLVVQLIKFFDMEGYDVIIVTSRLVDNEDKNKFPDRIMVQDIIEKYDLPISKVIFTNHKDKGPFLRQEKACIHFDDREDQIQSAQDCGIFAIKWLN